ncbi:uncharacterized protein HD556DRAFT_1526843 [Suillus plorans]|uniref:BTB domain-containing protein n=1 Tax=Suillus plorans TaxID=116603 RepID=A0A9P7ARP7_9AGAM|nr:uncharacterized protein HD556DRAFT_1526843 [Suillus plorans]KAG1795104.1 hypothetical protein HD556DRAFT_1526843 [Suillus plorans]
MSNAEEITTAEAPFDDHDCDCVLQSSNRVNFHVYKLILSLMSPKFKDEFTSPQSESQSDKSSVPIMTVAESSTPLRSLLLLCYPAATPTFDSLDNAKAVLEAAKQYNMQAVLSRAGDLIIAQFLPDHFLDLYALSCRFGWQHHAQTAATRALEIKDLGRPSNGFHGLQDISGADYHRLLVYHYQCGVIAQTVGDSLSWLPPSSTEMQLQMWKCKCRLVDSAKKLEIGNIGELKIVPWFAEYLVSSGKELLARPCESTIMESKYYNQAVIEATKCDDCRSEVIEDMDRFRALYIAQVKKVVATVSFPCRLVHHRFKAHLVSVGGIGNFLDNSLQHYRVAIGASGTV